ncbi:MAG: TIGR01777 family oxidoreductase, partial [bacterium]
TIASGAANVYLVFTAICSLWENAMRILISGASGLIGAHLAGLLNERGHDVVRLVRRSVQNPSTEIFWHPESGEIDRSAIASSRFDAAVHLAGRSIASLWTARHKRLVRSSRIDSGRLLASTLAALKTPPSTYISMSATGYYGNRGDEILVESSAVGTGFMANLCRDWEASADPLREAGVRVVHPRMGIVLSQKGGFLAPLLPFFRLGLGARIGDRRQWLSWIHVDDAVAALLLMLDRPEIHGPVNVTSPNPVTMGEFTETLACLLHRSAPFSVPAALLKLLPGSMGEEMFLTSQRVHSGVLQESGFPFTFERLKAALEDVLLS